ncbi:MAG: 50S ribosomal protein L18 [Nanoarchaeota archaeon]|nr:50S ribosomal protein L18 [Nanoarchaeota archaeon]
MTRMRKVPKRRRQEGKTDYAKRMKLLKGNSPRIIFRRTNRYIISQYVTSKEAQDKIVFGTSSKELLKHGWPKEASGSLKSLTASYFTGFLAGKKILKEKLKAPILDFGMNLVLHKSREFAFIKGLVDSGVKIKTEEKAFPEESRIKGEHMKNKVPFAKIKENIEGEK